MPKVWLARVDSVYVFDSDGADGGLGRVDALVGRAGRGIGDGDVDLAAEAASVPT